MCALQDRDVPQPTEEAANALFFARCPPTLPHEELLQLFSQYGEVKELNLYRRWAKAKNSKGCGTVVFADNACAQAAMEALNGKHEWPESEAKMVVEWCVPEKLQVKSKATENNETGAKSAVKSTKSAAKSTKSHPLLKLQNGDQLPSHQRLRKTWSHSLLDGYSSGSDQDSPIPANLMAGMMCNSSAGPLCNHHLSSAASNPFMQLANNWAAAPNTLLHNMVPTNTDYLDQDDVVTALSNLQNNHISSCNCSLTSTWGCKSSPDLQQYTSAPLRLLPDADDIWQQQQAAVAAVVDTTGLTSTRSSISSGTMPCSAVYEAASLCSLMDDASMCGSTEYACDKMTVSAGLPAPEVSTSLPPSSITALSLLQLQQLEQQQRALMLAKFAVATSSSPLPILPEQYMDMAASTAPAGAAVHAAEPAAPKFEEVRVDLNLHSLNVIAPSIEAVSSVSGACVTIDASRDGVQLGVIGLADQVEAACNCLRYVLAMGGLEGVTGRCD